MSHSDLKKWLAFFCFTNINLLCLPCIGAEMSTFVDSSLCLDNIIKCHHEKLGQPYFEVLRTLMLLDSETKPQPIMHKMEKKTIDI